MGARHNDQRCPYCGARLIVMRFHEHVSYHCRTHGPLVLDADGNAPKPGGGPAERTTEPKRKPIKEG
jgi:hypothetical protein